MSALHVTDMAGRLAEAGTDGSTGQHVSLRAPSGSTSPPGRSAPLASRSPAPAAPSPSRPPTNDRAPCLLSTDGSTLVVITGAELHRRRRTAGSIDADPTALLPEKPSIRPIHCLLAIRRPGGSGSTAHRPRQSPRHARKRQCSRRRSSPLPSRGPTDQMTALDGAWTSQPRAVGEGRWRRDLDGRRHRVQQSAPIRRHEGRQRRRGRHCLCGRAVLGGDPLALGATYAAGTLVSTPLTLAGPALSAIPSGAVIGIGSNGDVVTLAAAVNVGGTRRSPSSRRRRRREDRRMGRR